MTDNQIRDRIVGALSISMMPMEMEAECVAFLDRGLTAMTWISPIEKQPKIFERVLICREKEPGELIVEQGFLDVGNWWKVYGTRVKKIYAWMPIPKPPKESSRSRGEEDT